jgi:hypothetical protein
MGKHSGISPHVAQQHGKLPRSRPLYFAVQSAILLTINAQLAIKLPNTA